MQPGFVRLHFVAVYMPAFVAKHLINYILSSCFMLSVIFVHAVFCSGLGT